MKDLSVASKQESAEDSPRVLAVLSSLLEKIVSKNDKLLHLQARSHGPCTQRLTVFHGVRVPSISIERYVERIFKYAKCSPACFVVAYVYLDRFVSLQQGFPINSLNVHRLLITSVMVTAKFLDDSYYNNAYYAKVGGVMLLEMNRLELEFLFRLGFRLHVSVHDFDSYCARLEREIEEVERGITQGPTLSRSYFGQNNCNGFAIQHAQRPHCEDDAHVGRKSSNPAAAAGMAESCSYVAANVLESVSQVRTAGVGL